MQFIKQGYRRRASIPERSLGDYKSKISSENDDTAIRQLHRM